MCDSERLTPAEVVVQPMTRDEAAAMRGAHAMDEVPDDTAPITKQACEAPHQGPP